MRSVDAGPLRRRCSAAALLFLTGVGPACTESGAGGSPEARATVPLQADDPELPPRVLPAVDVETHAPMSLTASDGTGLRLVSLEARAVVQAPLAFTELHLTFENPEDRTLEGQFTIDLPVDAAISRFAMKIGGAWQEGEVVERQAARVAYEDFLHRKQDPALLENQAGNRFSARVFPIPARAKKELVLSYSQALTDSHAPYELPLAGLPRLDLLDVEVVIEQPTRDVTRVRETDFTPTEDLAVPLPDAGEAIGLRRGELAVARVTAAGSLPPAPLRDLTILFDTSASRGLGFGGHVHRLGALVEALREDGDFPLRIVAFDQEVALMFDGNASELGIEQLTEIYSRRALGASDLGGALTRLAESGVPASRVLVISDGVATAGDTDAGAIEEAVRGLAEHGVQRIDAIADAGLQDRPVLEALTTAGLEQAGIVADAHLPAHELAGKLRKATLERVAVTVPGSRFAWPRTIEGVQPGDEVLVYAQLPADAGMTVVLGGDTPAQTEVELVEVDTPLLERALAGARIEALTLQRSELGDDAIDDAAKLREQIVALSTKYRVISDFTAMLVLETEHDYVRFGIDRNALADVMTIADGHIELHERSGAPDLRWRVNGMVQPESGHFLASPYGNAFAVGEDDEDVWGGLTGTEIGEAFGVGGLGLVGTGRGGGGTGEGTIGLSSTGLIGRGGGGSGSGYGRGSRSGFGGRGRIVPRVRQAKAEVRGALDRDIVRRIVRAHINEVRHCYNQGLVRDPNLRGRVAVQFVIGERGKVATAVVAESSLKDANVGRCIAVAVRRWAFPRPGDGNNVVVTYPFVLEPGAAGHGTAPAPRPAPAPAPAPSREPARTGVAEPPPPERETAYTGRMVSIMDMLEAGNVPDALAAATSWRDDAPGDVVALLALGEALEAAGRKRAAARAYGSLVDLFPSRADLRRYAGQRLERLGDVGRTLAIDTYREAVEQRPDHPNSHRLYAYALVRAGRLREAFEAIEAGAKRSYPPNRFAGVDRILRDDVGLVAAAWITAAPDRSAEIRERVRAVGAIVPSRPSTRFVMSWETDSNDVDFHIRDGRGGYAFYGEKSLPSGGSLYADVTTGYGPECFAIEGEAAAYPYRFDAKYYARGPMGYGMGKLQILEHDGKGGLRFEDRPFIIMRDHAYVNLGTLDRSLAP